MIKKLKNLNLLYIEDDIATRDNYVKTFHIIFNHVFTTDNYEQALFLFNKEKIDFILLDIELSSQQDGFDIANSLKKKNANIPIVFLTAHDETTFVLKAINSSINGYIIKPLNLDKLIDITKKLFQNMNDSEYIEFKVFKYYVNTLELFHTNGNKIPLGNKENRLLQLFLKNKNKILCRELLEYSIWEEPLSSNTTLKNLIASLRNKIGKDSIINISKLGWKINFV